MDWNLNRYKVKTVLIREGWPPGLGILSFASQVEIFSNVPKITIWKADPLTNLNPYAVMLHCEEVLPMNFSAFMRFDYKKLDCAKCADVSEFRYDTGRPRVVPRAREVPMILGKLVPFSHFSLEPHVLPSLRGILHEAEATRRIAAGTRENIGGEPSATIQ